MTKHSLDTPQFYLTAPQPCPYLEGQVERKVFTHLVGDKAIDTNDMLTHGGFRRSQNIAYRPACEFCKACVSTRVQVDHFKQGKNLKRVFKKNADLIGNEIAALPTQEQYSLFRSYLDARHWDGGMVDMTSLDYAMMVEDTHVNTKLIEYRRRGPDSGITGKGEGPLIAVSLIDQLRNGLSMVYSFFDPFEASRSLGSYMILDHIERTKKKGLPYLYLGYWVKGSEKMEYKTRFQPQEHLTATGWQVTNII